MLLCHDLVVQYIAKWCLSTKAFVQINQYAAAHGPSLAQANVLGAHLGGTVHSMWPNPAPCIVPPRADVQGFTALHAAALSAQGTMTMLLLDMVLHASGAQLATRELATMESSLLVRLLKARDAHGRSAIHVAAGAANAGVCSVLDDCCASQCPLPAPMHGVCLLAT